MAINFPVNPVEGQTYSYGDYTYTFDGVKWTSVVKYGSSAVKIQSSTPPESPEVGLQWYDDISGRTYFWHVNETDGIGQWVEDAPQGVTDSGVGQNPSIVYVQEEMPVGASIPSGAQWYKPSETESYIYYVDPQGNKQWIEEDSVGDDGGSSFNFTQEDAPTERLFLGARWFKPSTSQEFIYYIGPNDVGVWTEANDTGDSASAIGIETTNGNTVQELLDANKATITELSSGKYNVGAKVMLSDRDSAPFNIVSGGTANGIDIIDAGNGNTAVLFGYDVINLKYLGFSESNSAAQNTAIFNRAKELSNLITGTAGEFNLENLVLDKDVYLTFAGRTATKLNISGFVTYGGLKTSCLFKGDDAKGLASLTNLEGVEINITNTEPNSIGALISRKTNWFDVYIHGATLDGIYFRAFDANNESPYFCNLTNVWSKLNGRNGVTFTDNCNANVLTNGQYDSNGERGVVQTQVNHGDTPIAVYNNTLVNGQVSYNQLEGIYVERGSEFIVSGTYTEFNSQADGGNPKTGAYKNLRINNLAARCKCFLGSVGTSTDVEQVVDAGSNLSNEVYVGGVRVTPYNDITLGYENAGSGKKLRFNGTAGCVHIIEFAEGTTVPAWVEYNGVPSSPLNEISFNVNSGNAPIKYRTNGQLAFFGETPITRPTVSASATDSSTTQTLVNELRQALIDLGLVE